MSVSDCDSDIFGVCQWECKAKAGGASGSSSTVDVRILGAEAAAVSWRKDVWVYRSLLVDGRTSWPLVLGLITEARCRGA